MATPSTATEPCEELCDRRIRYEAEILGQPTISLEKCVRHCRSAKNRRRI